MAKKRRRSSAPRKPDNKPGRYAFLAGIIIALIAGLFTNLLAGATVSLILAILGLIVGFLNVSAKETTEFLVASIALVLLAVPSGLISQIQVVGVYLEAILINIATFVIFAALIVALKAIWQLAEN
jgi:uncharacterized membrane protein YfhO